jgi:hypothetical protein
MTRFTNLFAALALTGGVVAATVAACANRPASPGEMQPLAPRPDNAPSAMPVPGLDEPGHVRALPPDAGISLNETEGPTYRLAAVVRNPASPTGQPPDPANAPTDAGTQDSYTPPLPPIPDAKLPVPLDAPAHPATTAMR